MYALSLPEAINTRLVFRIYGWLAVAAGMGLESGPGLLMPADLAAKLQPAAMLAWGHVAVPRLTGAALFGAALCAFGFGAADDPVSRRRGLYRFAWAHLIFGVYFFGVTDAILGSIMPPIVEWIPLFTGAVLMYFAITAHTPRIVRLPAPIAGDAPDTHGQVVVDKAAGTGTLPSEYEAQIRHAARQEERGRLARDLHDAVKQQLFAIQTAAATVEARFDADPAGARAAIDQIRGSAREGLAEMQAMIDHLQAAPMENRGLVDALRNQCEALGFRTGADVRLEIGDLPPTEHLPPGAPLTLFRFAQEALANVGRHARARNVTVRLGLNNHRLDLTVADDGVGFDATEWGPGMGRRSMMARAADVGGTFLLKARPGAGTLVQCSIPYDIRSAREYGVRALLWATVSVILGWVLALMAAQDVDFTLSRALLAVAAATAALTGLRYAVALIRVRRRAPA